MFLSLYDEVTNVLYVSLLSHDRPEHILVNTCNSCCDVKGADVTKECLETKFHLSSTLLNKLCVHYANGFDNAESVYFFYSNPVLSVFFKNISFV
jgi:hypothetical protein